MNREADMSKVTPDDFRAQALRLHVVYKQHAERPIHAGGLLQIVWVFGQVMRKSEALKNLV